MLRAYKYRIYPTKAQAEQLNKTLGACRFIYNLALETKTYAWQAHRKNISEYALMAELKELRKVADWLREADSQALNASIKNLTNAYKNFFSGNNRPVFKSRKSIQRFQTRARYVNVNWQNNTLTIPKLENIPILLSRKFDGKIKTVTIIKTPTGKYFASILVDTITSLLQKTEINNALGIDLGLKHFVITSDGEKFDNPKYLRNSIARLKILQRRAARKVKGSNNRRKANFKVALLHEKISNQRQDFLHKLSSKLIYDNQIDTICVEGLRVHNMMQNHKLAQSIQDASWSEFFRQLKYKAEWSGKNILEIGTFAPSSKMCSACGEINSELTLADREWKCKCGVTHDRDINAAINIRNIALSGKGIPIELAEVSALVEPLKQECLIN